MAYRNSPILFGTVLSRPPLPQDWGLETPKFQSLLSKERVKLRTSKFGLYIRGIHPNKSPLKFWRKGSVGVSRDCPIFKVPSVIYGTVKTTNFKFCTHVQSIDRYKSPLKISGKVAVHVVRDSRKFSYILFLYYYINFHFAHI